MWLMIAIALGLLPGNASQGAAKPLKIFILAGQSNMQGHANVSTMESMADDPKTAPALEEMRKADGAPRVCKDVWISSIGCAGDDSTEQTGRLTAGFGASPSEIGPEFTFGISMEKLLREPLLIIKTSWGGKSLITDFRPPSAGPYVWSEYEVRKRTERHEDVAKQKAEKIKQTGVYYRLMIDHVTRVLSNIQRVVPEYDLQQGYELAGFVWFQGFNDLVSTWSYETNDHGCEKPGGYEMYSTLLADFIRDVRKDLNAPKLPFVVGVMGIGGVKEDVKPGNQKYFRQAQAAPASLPEFKGNVVAVPTAPFWDDDLEVLRTRLESLWPKMDVRAAEALKKNPKLTEAEVEAVKRQVAAENFTPEEQKRLKAASNGGYHYLGAVKILAPIGQAFAEPMADLQKNR
jgi:hypothetical protein